MRLLAFIIVLLSHSVFSQNDSIKSTETGDTTKFKISFKIVDFELGGSCGIYKTAGSFLCKLISCEDKKISISKKAILIIQCPRDYSEDYFVKGGIYESKMVKKRPINFAHLSVARFDKLKLKEYYVLRHIDKQ